MTLDRSSALGGNYSRPAIDSGRIEFRRALALTLMTVIMPGSAQLILGNKRIGRMAIRVWLGVIVSALVVVLIGMTSRTGLFSLFTNSLVLNGLRLVLLAGAIWWVAPTYAKSPTSDDGDQRYLMFCHRWDHVLRRPFGSGPE